MVRRPEHLTAKFAPGGSGGREATVRMHTGAQFESGAVQVHAARGRNDSGGDAERLLQSVSGIKKTGHFRHAVVS